MGDIYHYTEGAAIDLFPGMGQHRHMFITSKGVLWYVRKNSGVGTNFYCSTDNGDTWTLVHTPGAVITCGIECSIFCDEKDNIHFVWAHHGGGNDGRSWNASINYMHGVLNATHTSITFGTGYQLAPVDMYHCPDVVAHEHNGQIRVHAFANYNWAGDNRHITIYWRLVVNINDVATGPVSEAGVYLHDQVGGQTYPGKVTCELRHNGNGKTPQSVNGVRTPDVFYSYTHGNLLHFGRIAWAGGNTWTAPAQQFMLDSGSGNRPSVSSLDNNGGLYEHHRWATVLYSARDNQCVVVGWMMWAANTNQFLGIWEVAVGSASANVGVALTPWWTGTGPCMISGAATLDPDGNVFLAGTTLWSTEWGFAQIPRPRGSLTRAMTTPVAQDGGGANPNGTRVDILPYPQGEQHSLWMRSENIPIHWRHNKTCAWVVDGGNGWQRRPKFRKNTDGNWVPIQSAAL